MIAYLANAATATLRARVFAPAHGSRRWLDGLAALVDKGRRLEVASSWVTVQTDVLSLDVDETALWSGLTEALERQPPRTAAQRRRRNDPTQPLPRPELKKTFIDQTRQPQVRHPATSGVARARSLPLRLQEVGLRRLCSSGSEFPNVKPTTGVRNTDELRTKSPTRNFSRGVEAKRESAPPVFLAPAATDSMARTWRSRLTERVHAKLNPISTMSELDTQTWQSLLDGVTMSVADLARLAAADRDPATADRSARRPQATSAFDRRDAATTAEFSQSSARDRKPGQPPASQVQRSAHEPPAYITPRVTVPADPPTLDPDDVRLQSPADPLFESAAIDLNPPTALAQQVPVGQRPQESLPGPERRTQAPGVAGSQPSHRLRNEVPAPLSDTELARRLDVILRDEARRHGIDV